MNVARLLLFDIDGTLLKTNGIGSAAMLSALGALYQRPIARGGVEFAGRTDHQIIYDLLAANHLPLDDYPGVVPEVFRIFPGHLRQAAEGHQPHLLPGVAELLAELARQPGIGLGLVTGNNYHGAKTKLELVGLDFNLFPFGAFGSDAADRNALPPIALERAARYYGRMFAPAEALVIGDTPADIACARASGIPVLAVATGWSSLDELASYTPDHLLSNLADLQAALKILL